MVTRRLALLCSLVAATLTSTACDKGKSVETAPPEAPTPAPTPTTEEPAAPPMDPVAEIQRLSERAQTLFDVPGMAVAVVVKDEVVFAEGFGEIEKGKGAPVNADTSFAIASNTKAFTATAVGMLVADGKIRWDDEVVKHLPDLELWNDYVTESVTVRDLLSHRVGLSTWEGDMMWLSSKFDRDTVMKRLKHLPPTSSLRERYGYCNLMFMVAGALIEEKSGQDWDAYLRAKILDPLGMKTLSTRVGQLEARGNVAKPHIEVDGKWETTPYLDLATIGPAASFHASVNDLVPWVRMQLADGELDGKRVVPEDVIRETRQPHMWLRVPKEDFYEPGRHFSGYGLGWSLADYRDTKMVAHGGGMPGMTSRVLLFPDADVGVVVLTSSESGVSGALAIQIADLFLAEEGEARKDYLGASHERAQKAKEGEVPPKELAGDPPKGLEGRWKNPMLGKGLIAKDGDGLYFTAPDHGGLRCRLYAPDDTKADKPEKVPCRWDDPNMGVSQFRLEYRGAKVKSLAFKVRPEFYDPLEYTFTRR